MTKQGGTIFLRKMATAGEPIVSLWRRRPYAFSALWLLLFLFSFSFLSAVGFVPALLLGNQDVLAAADTAVPPETSAPRVVSADGYTNMTRSSDPIRIIIDAIDVSVEVVNPAERDIPSLNAALRDGVVRYPSPGTLEDNGNILLFGHSTGFRVVQNQNYKVFNNLKRLAAGDVIRLQSAGREYVYTIAQVSEVDANETGIEFVASSRRLTLVTCNVFGEKERRFVVEADFIGSRVLPNGSGESY